jgi:hypothetical protein
LISEASLARNDFNRMRALLNHKPRPIEPKTLNCFRRRHAGLGMKGATELTGAKTGGLSECLHGKWFTQILPSEGQSFLDGVGLRVHLQQC